jgi:glyoxylase-like metal-dependent hydrolase (beta-lactamase superfamily II)
MRRIAAVLLVVIGLSACRPESRMENGPDNGAPLPDTIVRTADPVKRGLSESAFPRVQRLSDNVYTYEQLRSAGEERFTTVSLIVVTDVGVLVADGQGNLEETERLVAAIGEITDQPITHVVIASDHGDHTAGNAAFPATAQVLAHPTSAAVLQASAVRAEGEANAPRAALPNVLVEDRLELDLGGTAIHVLFLGRAHTGGDLVVHMPAERIAFMSEAFLNRVFPAMRSAYPSEWVAMLERAKALDADVYVPGHGFVESPAVLAQELDTFRIAVEQVIAESTRLHRAGIPLEAAIDSADFGALESWSLRSSQGPIAIRRVYAELNGELPAARSN